MNPFSNRPFLGQTPYNTHKIVTQKPVNQVHLSPNRHSQVSSCTFIPQINFPNQRISTVSSQKVSVVTKATNNEFIQKTPMIGIQSPKSQRFFENPKSHNIENQAYLTKLEFQNESLSFRSPTIPTNPEEMHLNKKQISCTVYPDIPNNSQYKINRPIHKQKSAKKQHHLIVSQYTEQIMIPPSKSSITGNTIKSKVQQNRLIPKAQIKEQPNKITKLQSKTPKRTIVQSSEAPLVSNVVVQNIQLPPIIRNPLRKIQNRLYRSAVYDRRGVSVRPASRARSTTSFIPKTKKRDVYIRCPHRSFISDKKIPVIGSYVSKDKSKEYVIRQLATNLPKSFQSKVIGTEFIEIIPTDIIKVPLTKLSDLNSNDQNSILNDDVFSYTSNPIIDQPTLIKKYISDDDCRSYTERRNGDLLNDSFCSNRSSRLSDNIKVSVYRSPSVIVKKAEIITSGPKLSKNHVMRVVVQGKTISKYEPNYKKQCSSDKSSTSNGPRYQTPQKYTNITPISNPYVKQNISDIVNRLRKQTQQKLNTTNIQQISAYYQTSFRKDNSNHDTMLSQYNNSSSQNITSQTQTHLVSSTYKSEEKLLLSQVNLQASIHKSVGFADYLTSSHKRNQSVNKILFESPIQTINIKESDDTIFDIESSKIMKQVSIKSYQSSLSLQNLNRHKYKIPKLSSDLEQELKRLRLQNEKKKKQLQDNWQQPRKERFFQI